MEIIDNNEFLKRGGIKYVVNILKNSKTLVYPTETSYALGCSSVNKKAINQIYKIKQRDKNKFLPFIASSKYQVLKFFKINKHEKKYINQNWPGPYTIILRRKNINDLLQISNLEVAVRVSSLEFTQKLARGVGFPIISTSANLSGAGSFYNAKEIYEHFKNQKYKPDLILDFGILPKRNPSKIVKFDVDKIIFIR